MNSRSAVTPREKTSATYKKRMVVRLARTTGAGLAAGALLRLMHSLSGCVCREPMDGP